MIEHLNERFQMICHQLNKGSCNYQIDVVAFPCNGLGGMEAQTILKKGLKEGFTLGNCFSISPDEALKEIENGFDYRGDEGSRPDWSYLDSEAFLKSKNEIMDILRGLFSSSTQVIGFWLKSGHPFYPVFWDYSYIVENESDAFILIGSSSD